jgi:threonine aldolase
MQAARRWRKRLGGGMRQSGVLAAAGLVALDTMVERLSEDHRTARLLAGGLAELPGCSVDLDRVETNIVRMTIDWPADRFVEECRGRGVLCFATSPRGLRLVTHHGVSAEDVGVALGAIGDVAVQLSELSASRTKIA